MINRIPIDDFLKLMAFWLMRFRDSERVGDYRCFVLCQHLAYDRLTRYYKRGDRIPRAKAKIDEIISNEVYARGLASQLNVNCALALAYPSYVKSGLIPS